MKRLDCSEWLVDDVLDADNKTRDRICAEWIGEYGRKDVFDGSSYWHEKQTFPDDPDRSGVYEYRWPKYSHRWEHAGRLIEVLPKLYKDHAWRWIGENTFGLWPNDPFSKKWIVIISAICCIKGIEPERN